MGSRAAQPRLPWWRRVPDLQQLVLVTLVGLYSGAVVLALSFEWLRTGALSTPQPYDGIVCGPIIRCPMGGSVSFPEGVDRLNILIAGVDNNYDSHGMLR